MTPSARLSVDLQDIAARLQTMLEQSAGEPCAFVLVCQADGVAQYVSNADRKDGRELTANAAGNRLARQGQSG